MSDPPRKTIKLRSLIKPKNQQQNQNPRNEIEKHLDPNRKQKSPPRREQSPKAIHRSQTIPSIPESFKKAYSDVRNSPSFSADIKKIADKITSYRYAPWKRRLHRFKPY